MIEALRVTLIGMGLVFAAMALVLGAILLLTRIRQREPASDAVPQPQAASEPAPTDEHTLKVRAAVIAAAIARARRQAPSMPIAPPIASNTVSPWMAYHRSRQLGSKP